MRFASRKRREFERKAMPHLRILYGVARQMADPQVAEDLVQETYLRAWKYFESFDPETNPRAWLFRILRNVWLDRCHKSRLEFPLPDESGGAVEPYYDWEGDYLAAEFSEEMDRALSALPDEYRWAVLLADVEEFSYQEIAGIMQCPIGTVMSRINRGRRMLARQLRPKTASQPERERSRTRDSLENKA